MEDKELDIDSMSDAELLKHEAELEEAEEAELEEQQAEGDSGKESAEPSEDDTQASEEQEAESEEGNTQEEINKDVSPPEKWIRQRHKAREQARQQEENQSSEEESVSLQEQLDEAKQTIELMRAKGVDVPNSPMDMLSDENISAVREEHGDSVADMFLGLRAVIPAPKGKAEAGKPRETVEQDGDRVSSLFQNDHLAYWYQKKPDFFNKYATKADKILSGDPSFYNKTYPEQAKAIVEKAKELVLAEKKPKNPVKPAKKGKSEPPSSLSGAVGTALATDNKGPSGRMIELAEAGKTDEAMRLYEKLPDGNEKLKFEDWMEENEE